MKAAIISESPADEAAVKILASAVLRLRIEAVPAETVRAGGWSAALRAVSSELYRLHYKTDAQALIVVIDSDDTSVHDASHATAFAPDCRVCQVQSTVRRVQASLTSRADRTEVKIAIGLPVPAIEAWYQCGKDPHAAEARFIRDIESRERLAAARAQLKRDVYGTDRPSLELETRVAVREATRIATDLERLRTQFPRGFGSFYETLATWR